MTDWNAQQYKKFERERTQPSIDLIHRIDGKPNSILDIGCGPGNSTYQLKKYFPKAHLLGIDQSQDMLAKAKMTYPDLSFQEANIPNDLGSLDSYDLIFSNACLHWIPDHSTLLPKLINQLNDHGVLAVQMPMVQTAIFYRCLNEVLTREKWNRLRNIHNFHNLSPNETFDILMPISNVTMWETTYYHVLENHDAIIEWYKGSGLRPYLNLLSETKKEEFISDVMRILQKEIPMQKNGSVLLKMPRLFFIARK
ncbi:MAG: methyltransferase domain-containing protein [Absicoccus porci]|uniref:methyltransferase domain-containing protein n=1 Tax=Absicoccus porci TaxID=2486576 RepID=UPI0023558EA1|nr:methyltransferase domain-containing protein [Absicoccus porci]MCI6087770.1 methyltransferase domain-containing protein [Absicoccus porci]MDD7331189.1 methyltransferase domain-containing protein [Absicoccus porci]MDY4738152.1 methyltransferase domain-containing protein [Absicoccus porci]